jgi:hypothetical protein
MSAHPAPGLDDPPVAAAAGARPSLSGLLGVLRNAKEIVMVLAFFGAGLLWVVNYFATRDQLDTLECFTKVNVRMLQATTNVNQAEQSLRQTRTEIREQRRFVEKARAKDSGYSEDDVRTTESRLEELSNQVGTFDRAIDAERKAAHRSLTALTQNQCLVKEQRARIVSQIGAGDF